MQPDMIVTWADVLTGRYAGGHRVYVMYDGDHTCLYVGKSKNTDIRLLSHVGRRSSKISEAGRWIMEHSPESSDWAIALYLPELPPGATLADRLCQDDETSELERRMIYALSPIFNDHGLKSDTSKVSAFWRHHEYMSADIGKKAASKLHVPYRGQLF